jgi:glycosyltransferase involved in cell wall biosynthesis
VRILYSHRIQSRDGQSVHVEAIVAALRAAGHEVLVVGPGFYSRADFGSESRMVAQARRLLPQRLGELAELAYNVPAYWRLRRACRSFRPDLLYERYNLFYLAGALLARRRRLLFYVEVNAPLADERARFGGLRSRRLARRLERFVWGSADRVLVVTGVLQDMLAAWGVPADRIAVTPNGIDPGCFTAPARSPPPPGGPLVLGFVGFVRSWHGLDAVIRAMAGYAGDAMRLVVVGDGPALAALARQAALCGLADRVHFTGLVERQAIPELVAGFDIALQPKVVPYASPLKVFEYMAAGCAIVAPDQPNIREILEHERSALLFDPAEDGAMWQAIRRLAEDPGLRARLGLAARAAIYQRDHTWHGNAERIVAWAHTDLERSRARRARGPASLSKNLTL